jgi:aryl-alcohol dehydrogenase-like predicted oxidoreductase
LVAPVQNADVEFRTLGRSGLQISSLVYGNWITHGSQVGDDLAVECVHAALDVGITTFDTADAYADGRAEEVLGSALKGQRRSSVEILTKAYAPMGSGRNESGLSRKHIREGLDASLRRLGVEYVDVYQAHRYDLFTPLEETMLAYADAVRAGKVLYVGVSEWSVEQLREAHALARELHVPLISNQPQYSMIWRVIEDEVVPACEELGLSQIVWSPLAQGVLTGKYKPGEEAPEGSRATDATGGADFIKGWLNDFVLERVAKLAPIASDLDLTMAQLAIAWVLQNKNVAGAIIGASRPEQVRDNAKAAGVELTDDVLKAIDEALDGIIARDPALVKKSTPKTRWA